MKILLFEDNQCDILRPAGLFRPLYKLQVASTNLCNIVKRLDIPILKLIRDHFLIDSLTNPEKSALESDTIFFLNASVEPDVNYLNTIRRLIQSGDPFVATSGNRVSAALVPTGTPFPDTPKSETISAMLLEMGLPLEKEIFNTIDWPHEIIDAHLRLFDSNLADLISCGRFTDNGSNVYLGEKTDLPPTCALNTDGGPIVIDDDVHIKPFTYIEGPVYIGRETRVIEHSAIKDRTSIGNNCKIGGEVEASIIESYSNKQHHGFLGHSWVGRWVNMGAGTSSSDLKNTYGKVRMDYNGNRTDTGMQFLGSIIGDFAKTAVNTSLFTGKCVGPCSMIYGTVTKNVPSFSNYARSFGQVTEFSLDQVLLTQRRMFRRRRVEQNSYDIELMKRVFDMTRNERVMSDAQINF